MSLIPGRRSLSVAVTALAAGIASLSASGSALAATSTTAPSYLFSIPGTGGSLTGPNAQHLTLRLTGARRYLTRFTDAPLREAAVVANVDFARRFASYFADAHPNAVLTYTPAHARTPVSVVVTIRHPRWNAKRATWTFSATRIRKRPDTLPGTSVHITPPVIPNPRRFAHATLLIDDAAAGGACTRGDVNYFPSAFATLLEDSYAPAKGNYLPVSEFQAVFSVIGTKFGGDGIGAFALPNVPSVSSNVASYFCLSGVQPEPDVSQPARCLAGNVQLTSETDFTPEDWLPANGQDVPIAEYPILFSQIGTTFGGDGVRYFALPKLAAPHGLQDIICANGVSWTPGVYSSYQCTLGELDLFATTSLPQPELHADGRLASTGYASQLFSTLGTAFGGDGNQTFGLPDPPVPLKGTSWGICAQGVEPAQL